MKFLKQSALFAGAVVLAQMASAHYPFVAPLAYQTFNNHSAIISGFYDNPFASEVHIKNFNFHYHTPHGEKRPIQAEQWSQTATLSSLSLENKMDGTYRIRGEKQGTQARFAYVDKKWKALLSGQPKDPNKIAENVVYTSQLKKNASIKTVQTIELIETFVSRRMINHHVIEHIHDGFDVQFISHPNAIAAEQAIQFKVLDSKAGIADLTVEILKQTTDYSRDQKVYKTLKTNEKGELNFDLAEKGQYLLKVDYQQPFTSKSDQLKRYKYTLSFNVTD